MLNAASHWPELRQYQSSAAGNAGGFSRDQSERWEAGLFKTATVQKQMRRDSDPEAEGH